MSIVHIHKNIKICYVNDFIIFIYLLLFIYYFIICQQETSIFEFGIN